MATLAVDSQKGGQLKGAPDKPKERPSALRSVIAGSTAGAVEISMSSNTAIERK